MIHDLIWSAHNSYQVYFSIPFNDLTSFFAIYEKFFLTFQKFFSIIFIYEWGELVLMKLDYTITDPK